MIEFLLSAACTFSIALGDSNNNVYDSLPDGVVHFPLTRRSLAERVSLTRRAVDVYVDNNVSSFTAAIQIGSNKQNVSVIVDTGSSDLWVMAYDNPYCSSYSSSSNGGGSTDDSSSSISQSDKIKCSNDTIYDFAESSSFSANSTSFHITYGDGTFANGSYCQDTISYGSASISKANFALANKTDSANSVWGIGLAGLESTVTTYDSSGDFSPTYSNIPMQMKEQGIIKAVAYSLWLNDVSASTGQLLFGGVDHAKYNGSLQSVPLLSTYQGAKPNEFQIKLDKISLYQGSNSADIVTCALPALLDSGTTYMMLPQSFLDVIAGSIGGSCTSNGCYAPCDLAGGLKFDFSGIQISVPFSEISFASGTDCLLGMLPSSSIIMGDTFLRSAYVVYDLDNYEVALAGTNYNATSSSVEAITSGIPSATKASGYSSTSVSSQYSTSYATFFTDNNGATVSAVNSSGVVGGGEGGSSFGGANSFATQSTLLVTRTLSETGATSSSAKGRDQTKSNNKAASATSGFFMSVMTSVFGLIMYI